MVGEKRRCPDGIQAAPQQETAKLRSTRLARECAKLDPREERALAEEGIAEDLREWPRY